MIETIRIDKEYPTYADMLIPGERWGQDGNDGRYNDWQWSFATAEYYTTLYNPRVENAWWDFTEDSSAASKNIAEVGVRLLERAYGVQIGSDEAGVLCERTIEHFFRNADEWFIGPTGAEELLRNMIKGAVDLRKYAEAVK